MVAVSNQFLESAQRDGFGNLKMYIEDFSCNYGCWVQGQDFFSTFGHRSDNIHDHTVSVRNKPNIKEILFLDKYIRTSFLK